MVWTLRRTERALDDLADIWTYIAADKPGAADRTTRDLLTLFARTADHPHMGRAVEEIGEGMRVLPKGSYLLIYRLSPAEEISELVRVVHGAQDWRALFADA
jgi:toxin ParE1/3/4